MHSFPSFAVLLFLLIIFLLTTLYLVLSHRELKRELRMVFEPRLIRSLLRQGVVYKFTIADLLFATIVIAVFFTLVRADVWRSSWLTYSFVFACLFSGGLLARIALADLLFQGTRRRYRDRYQAPQPHEELSGLSGLPRKQRFESPKIDTSDPE